MQAATNKARWALSIGLGGLVCSISCAQFLADDHCTFHGAACDVGLVCSWCDHENRGCVAPGVASECIVAPYGDEPTTEVTTEPTTSSDTEAPTTTGEFTESSSNPDASTETTDGSESETDLDTDTPETCGDGVVQTGEACDDGNEDNGDACTNQCELATCGDGIVWVGMEACDDANQDNHDSCLNTCEVASCGDGFVRAGHEECDDQNNEVGDGCYQCWEDRLVFITSETFQGNLGGLAGADGLCQAAAEATELPGSFKAWLSSGEDMPLTTMVHAQGVYRRVDGVVIARGWHDLTDELIDATISVTELGEPVELGSWTNTEASGVVAADPSDCNGWTTIDLKGRWGSAQSIEPAWSNYINDLVNPGSCAAKRSLYCVMQEPTAP